VVITGSPRLFAWWISRFWATMLAKIAEGGSLKAFA
jgi:hypothetical protein